TQNPIEHAGTFPLPEAQLDRFLLHVVVDMPDETTERAILDLVEGEITHHVDAMTVRLSLADVGPSRDKPRRAPHPTKKKKKQNR
ncbi:AAA family ATPase, partial [Methylobacterium radiotolerans]|uniref:AAA family ATPase n=1 Tax=Methylobacterium radiotolerans TaxID=31998 RepID=UPI001FD9005F